MQLELIEPLQTTKGKTKVSQDLLIEMIYKYGLGQKAVEVPECIVHVC